MRKVSLPQLERSSRRCLLHHITKEMAGPLERPRHLFRQDCRRSQLAVGAGCTHIICVQYLVVQPQGSGGGGW